MRHSSRLRHLTFESLLQALKLKYYNDLQCVRLLDSSGVGGGNCRYPYTIKCTFEVSQLAGTWRLCNSEWKDSEWRVLPNQDPLPGLLFILRSDGKGTISSSSNAQYASSNGALFEISRWPNGCGTVVVQAVIIPRQDCFVSDDHNVINCHGRAFVRVNV